MVGVVGFSDIVQGKRFGAVFVVAECKAPVLGGKTVRKDGVIATVIIDKVVAQALRRAQNTLGQQTALELIVATIRGNLSKLSFQARSSDGLWTILAKAMEGVTAFEGLRMRMFIARIGGITTFLSNTRNPVCDV